MSIKLKYFITKPLEILIKLFENYFLKIFTFIFIGFVFIAWLMDVQKINDVSNYFNHLVSNNLDIFITLSSIFIGIYFTVLTLFLSYSAIGVIKNLEYYNIKKMINYILIGFIFSFLLLILALFFPYEPDESKSLLPLYSYVLLILLLNTMRFGLILLLWIRKFIQEYNHNKTKIIEKENEERLLRERLNNFLDEEDKKAYKKI